VAGRCGIVPQPASVSVAFSPTPLTLALFPLLSVLFCSLETELEKFGGQTQRTPETRSAKDKLVPGRRRLGARGSSEVLEVQGVPGAGCRQVPAVGT
jgi:hypothetical protein